MAVHMSLTISPDEVVIRFVTNFSQPNRIRRNEPQPNHSHIVRKRSAEVKSFRTSILAAPAVDAVDLKPGLTKALAPIRKQFYYLIPKQYGYGDSVFLNVNICRNNLDDVRQLTEVAHECGIATDYHINESAPLEQDEHLKHADQHVTYIAKDDWSALEETIQWLTEQDAGSQM
jgi:hypothetical protein